MELQIKYMVSSRCKMMVQAELDKLGLHVYQIRLGVVEIVEIITTEQRKMLKAALLDSGLELIEDKRLVMVDKIKSAINEMIRDKNSLPKSKISCYLSKFLNCNYSFLANVFSESEGKTIEQYILAQKIERVKELISNNDLNITEISYNLNYSSVAHLSAQFKKLTGLTPTYYRLANHNTGCASEAN